MDTASFMTVFNMFWSKKAIIKNPNSYKFIWDGLSSESLDGFRIWLPQLSPPPPPSAKIPEPHSRQKNFEGLPGGFGGMLLRKNFYHGTLQMD